ncbi:MAG: sulfite exporter TauE/SafE family protein, partial [Chloroflexota bacterium]|nr:sulfite exporter TauE/SafE family protein [Chloroflexota bacterium]
DNLSLRVDGHPVPLVLRSSMVERLAGQAGLETLRVTLEATSGLAVRDGASIEFSDQNYPGRIGWHDIVLRGTVADPSVGSSEPTNELRQYPSDPQATPPDHVRATGVVRYSANLGGTAAAAGDAGRFALDTSADRLAGILESGPSDVSGLLAALLVALVLGAFHALGPGHGKAMVAAYLVGSKGTAKQAVILGATVTVTHTLGVYALGAITLVAAQYVLPERLYPILGVLSGGMVVALGIWMLRARIMALRSPAHAHGHAHDHADDHADDHGEGPGKHRHDGPVGLRGLLALGVSGGLLPCPTALVVLLAAASFHNVLLGMILVAAFSVGLAAVLTGMGIAVVIGRRYVSDNDRAMRLAGSRLARRATRYLPALSAAAITIAGVVIAYGAARGFA